MITEDTGYILKALREVRAHIRTRKVRKSGLYVRRVITNYHNGIGAPIADNAWDDFQGTEDLFVDDISDGRHYPLPTEG